MIKKILAVAVTGVMMLAMSVSVFAAGNINENEKKILERLETIKSLIMKIFKSMSLEIGNSQVREIYLKLQKLKTAKK